MPRQKKTNTTPPAPAATPEAKPATVREPNDFQLMCCNLVADLIMNGGRRRDVEYLIRAIDGHQTYLRHYDLPSDDRDLSQTAVDNYFESLSRLWPKRQDKANPAPNTVSEQVRANLRDNLMDSINDFMANARMHELYLLHNVLMSFESQNTGSFSEEAESILASAFMYEIDGNKTYVKVPRKYIDLIEQYVRLLSGEKCEAA